MDAPTATPVPSADWHTALERTLRARRTVVIGATDVGKSSFVAQAMAAHRRKLALLDLDPGQKMVGAPGTISLGRYNAGAGRASMESFVFLGTTSASRFKATTHAAEMLAAGAGAFIANTAGFVTGPGTWLQVQTIAALQPDLIVATGGGLDRILAAYPDIPAMRIDRSPLAMRKTPARRAAIRQAAFAFVLVGAIRLSFDQAVKFEPARATSVDTAARPICALADARGDMVIGVLESFGSEILVHAPEPPRPPSTIRLGSMWAQPQAGAWKLLERLRPAWEERSPAALLCPDA